VEVDPRTINCKGVCRLCQMNKRQSKTKVVSGRLFDDFSALPLSWAVWAAR
jgi:hypothetical protein